MEKEVVGVKFLNGVKTYFFSPEGKKYKLNEKVVVSTENGLEVGVIVNENFNTDVSNFSELKPVVRRCTEKDFSILKKHSERTKTVFKEAQELIKNFNLEMKLLRVDCSFEGNKLIFT